MKQEIKRYEFLTDLLGELNNNEINVDYEKFTNIFDEVIFDLEIDYSIELRVKKDKCNLTIDNETMYDIDFDNAFHQIRTELVI